MSRTAVWQLADYRNGRPFTELDFSESGLPVIRIRQLLDAEAEPDRFDGVLSPKHRIDDGDIILAWSGTLAVRTWQRGPAALNQHLFRVDPRSGVVSRYLPWVLDYALEELRGHMHGSAMTHITTEMLKGVKVPVPPLDEQRRIAAFLDDQVARIDQAIALRERQLDIVNDYRSASYAEVFTGSPDRIRMNRLLTQSGVGVVVNPSSYFVDEGVPFIHGYNVRDGYFDLRDLKFMTAGNSAILRRSRLQLGDVLVVRAGYPGRAAVVDKDLVGGNCASVLVLRPGPRLLSQYLAAYFNGPPGKAAVGSCQYGAAQGVISLADVSMFKLPMCDIDSQRIAIQKLETALTLFMSLSDQLGLSVTKLEERKRSLITAAVTGEFDVSSASTGAMAGVTS